MNSLLTLTALGIPLLMGTADAATRTGFSVDFTFAVKDGNGGALEPDGSLRADLIQPFEQHAALQLTSWRLLGKYVANDPDGWARSTNYAEAEEGNTFMVLMTSENSDLLDNGQESEVTRYKPAILKVSDTSNTPYEGMMRVYGYSVPSDFVNAREVVLEAPAEGGREAKFSIPLCENHEGKQYCIQATGKVYYSSLSEPGFMPLSVNRDGSYGVTEFDEAKAFAFVITSLGDLKVAEEGNTEHVFQSFRRDADGQYRNKIIALKRDIQGLSSFSGSMEVGFYNASS